MSRIPQAVIDEVLERCHNFCELCEWPPFGDMHFHHRQARGMGGSKGRKLDVAANLMYLHDHCHQLVHANPESSRESGYIVSQHAETPS